MLKQKYIKIFIWFSLLLALIYGAGRIYFAVTDGFTVSEIASEVTHNPEFEIQALTKSEKEKILKILSERFTYLGKGCQSYVFASEDGKYVIKFLKYKHFTPQKWLNLFSFIPAMEEYRLKKIAMKQKKLEDIFTSWKIAYEDLQPETGVIFIHLNKSSDFNVPLTLVDKLGFTKIIESGQYEFLIQKRAMPFIPTLEELMKAHETDKAKQLLDNLLSLFMSEYERGLGDNDHAIMQNTGILDGLPIHIDAGQFVKNEALKRKDVQRQELFNKTYKFRIWLKKRYPELAVYLDEKLYQIIGPSMNQLTPVLKSLSCEGL